MYPHFCVGHIDRLLERSTKRRMMIIPWHTYSYTSDRRPKVLVPVTVYRGVLTLGSLPQGPKWRWDPTCVCQWAQPGTLCNAAYAHTKKRQSVRAVREIEYVVSKYDTTDFMIGNSRLCILYLFKSFSIRFSRGAKTIRWQFFCCSSNHCFQIISG